MNKYFKYSFVVTFCSFLTCAVANGMKPFVPANPAQYSTSTPRQDRHPFEPSSVSTTESVTEELPPHLQPLPFPHQQNVTGHMQQLIQRMNTAHPVTYTWTFNLSGYQVNITISNHGFHKYKFSINIKNETTNDKFVVKSEFGRFEVEGQGPYNRGFDFRNEIYLYHCTACPTTSSVLPHVYSCPFKSCGLGVDCRDPKQGHRGYCTHGGNHYPQPRQLIYRFDCELAQKICEDYRNRALHQDTLPKCPLDLFQHPLTLSSHQ